MKNGDVRSIAGLGLLCLLGVGVLAAFGETETDRRRPHQDMERISSCWQQNNDAPVDVSAVSALAAELETNWKQADRRKYAMLTLQLVQPLTSKGKTGQLQSDTARQYLLTTMEEPNRIPPKGRRSGRARHSSPST